MTFDWTITFGHLLSVVGMVAGIAAVVYTLRSDVKEIKLELAPMKEHIKQLAVALVQLARQDEQIKSLTHRVDKIEDRRDG